jgi:hypothetical protein
MNDNRIFEILGVTRESLELSIFAREFKHSSRVSGHPRFNHTNTYEFTCLDNIQVRIEEHNSTGACKIYRLFVTRNTGETSISTDYILSTAYLKRNLERILDCDIDLFGQ